LALTMDLWKTYQGIVCEISTWGRSPRWNPGGARWWQGGRAERCVMAEGRPGWHAGGGGERRQCGIGEAGGEEHRRRC
jgi:hypothetical protein